MTKTRSISPLLIVIAIMLVGSLGLNLFQFLTYQKQDKSINSLNETNNSLEIEKVRTESDLSQASSTIFALQTELNRLQDSYNVLEDDFRTERNKNNDFEDQIKDISKTVGTLDKLSKTDKELLQKYSKVYFLNENYIPSSLKEIDEKYILAGRTSQEFHSKALPFLKDMIESAADDGVDLKVLSAYRSFTTQQNLKGQYTQVYGTGANTFSADQGYSEHQLGTTVDVTDPTTAGAYLAFKDTEAYTWLIKNAYRYGFIESYPDSNGFYVFEPWHWRFVGTDLARDLHRDDAHFYDWDQRKIDTYLVKIFD